MGDRSAQYLDFMVHSTQSVIWEIQVSSNSWNRAQLTRPWPTPPESGECVANGFNCCHNSREVGGEGGKTRKYFQEILAICTLQESFECSRLKCTTYYMRSIHYSWGLLLKCTIYELICIKLGTTFIGMKYIQFKTIIAMQCNAMQCIVLKPRPPLKCIK